MLSRKAYPTVFSKADGGYLVYVPDFDINTFGGSIAEAIEMARDAIGITGISLQDLGQEIPKENSVEFSKGENDIVSLVDIDFEEYRFKNDNRKVRKNVTIPYYLNAKAEKVGVNFSRVLEEALLVKLGY